MPTEASAQSSTVLRSFRFAVLVAWLLGTAALVDHVIIFPGRPGNGPNRDFAVELPEKPTLTEVADAAVKHGLAHDRAKWLRSMRLMQADRMLLLFRQV